MEIDSINLIDSIKPDIERLENIESKEYLKNLVDQLRHQSIFNAMREMKPERLNDSWDWEGSYKNILMSSFLRIINFADTVPLLQNFNPQEWGIKTKLKKEEKIIEFILKEFPVIDDNVSYEQLIDFKSDNDSRRKFYALRNWMIEISKGDYSINEIEEKYQYLYSEYQAHLEQHKITTNLRILKGFAITTAEILGDLTSFKWGKAVKTSFEIFDKKAKLMQLEKSAPGMEIGYIYSANKEYNNLRN